MQTVVVRRILESPIALVAVLLVVFLALLATGDPVEMLAPPEATAQDKAQIRQAYGLDQPVLYQFGVFLSRAVRGDFGRSFFKGKAAMDLVLERFPASLQLAVASTLIAIAVAIPLGIIAGVARGTLVDQFVMALALVGQSVANFWLGLMLILLFSVNLRWLPVSGNQGPQSLVLPAVALSFSLLALLARLTRSEMLEVLGEDYIRTARAKGLASHVVLIRHALRNSLIPLVTMTGLSLGWQLGGAVVIESVFAWPGLGLLLLESVLRRDYPVVLAGVTLLAAVFILLNLLVDLLYAYIDPRIRLASS
ncbi:MAG: ABC transporter permease [Chloroflexi bacterium]|nr:ABC transporter permease [Chloroflexota bacterium]